MAALARLPVDDGRVLRDAVVPDDDSALLPLDAGLEVRPVRQVVVQEPEEHFRLLVLEADDAPRDCGWVLWSASFFFAYALPSYERTESGNKEGRGTSFFMSSFAYLFDEKEKRRKEIVHW